MSKPVVFYDKTKGIGIYGGLMPKSESGHLDEFVFSANIYTLNHPKLGATSVTTSKLLSFEPTTGVFETLNTIYRPA